MASLTRDIEQLASQLETLKARPITDIIEPISNKDGSIHKRYPSCWRMKSPNDPSLPKGIKQGGVYVFWWLKSNPKSLDPFYEPFCKRQYSLQGKKIAGQKEEMYHSISIEITDDWLTKYK